MQAAVHSLENVLRSEKKSLRFARRRHQHWTPRSAVFSLIDRQIPRIRWPRRNVLTESDVAIEAGHRSKGSAHINDVWIAAIEGHVSGFTGAGGKPMTWSNLPRICPAGNGRAPTVLLGSVNHIRKLVVGDHVVHLRSWLVIPGAPGCPAIQADRGPLIGSQHHAGRILGINPELVVVVSAGSPTHDSDRVSAVF